MRAVIYARYSSDNQRDASIEDQVRLCRERIEREGWQHTQTYADRAKSGSTLLRPGPQALIADAMAARCDVIVAEALDRLSRDRADVAALYKRLKFAGVPILTLAEGTISDLHVGLKGTMNALYLQDLADKTRRGLRGRTEAGRSAGGNAYGYAVVHEHRPGADPVRGGRTVNETEAAIARRIFQEFAAGRSPRRIAYALNQERIPGPSGVAWGPSTINGNAARGTGILNNEMHIGRLIWNRLRYVKGPDTGKRISRPNPPEQWIVQEVPELRIIDPELWEAVKERQRLVKKDSGSEVSNPEKPFWDRRRPRYLFSGLMRCGVCGGYSKISAELFGCATARNKGTCDNRLNIRRDVLEASVLNGLKAHLMDPALFQVFADAFTRELNRQRAAESGQRDRIAAELATVERKLRKIVAAISDGVPARTLKEELLAPEARQEELQRRLAETPAAAQPLLHPGLAALYRHKVAALHEALEDKSTKAEAVELIRALVEAIVLTPEDGQLRLDLHGQLAGILALARDGKKPSPIAREGLSQMKLVAGAGYHLCRTTLHWKR